MDLVIVLLWLCVSVVEEQLVSDHARFTVGALPSFRPRLLRKVITGGAFCLPFALSDIGEV